MAPDGMALSNTVTVQCAAADQQPRPLCKEPPERGKPGIQVVHQGGRAWCDAAL